MNEFLVLKIKQQADCDTTILNQRDINLFSNSMSFLAVSIAHLPPYLASNYDYLLCIYRPNFKSLKFKILDIFDTHTQKSYMTVLQSKHLKVIQTTNPSSVRQLQETLVEIQNKYLTK